MNLPRISGILLHPTSLPGRFGIGDLGQAAYDFVDFLATAQQSLWQVLPLGPTGYGDSPYQCFSAFAGNPLLVSPEQLVQDGLLQQSALDEAPTFPADRVDYGPVIECKKALLQKAYENFKASDKAELHEEFARFGEQQKAWLHDYAVYRSCKDANEGKSWTEWDAHLRDREAVALHFWNENHGDEITAHKFYQYLFFKQWFALAHYANDKGIKIIGDVPIFVAHDSADVWANPQLFDLNPDGTPREVAGVPPDYFSETGQLWGNPLYRWEVLAQTGYQWWIERIRATLAQVDIIRLDHFRGFEKYWAVPAEETTAVHGEWKEGPGAAFFTALQKAFGADLPIIAEDLGFITKEVHVLRDEFALPGMRILQFAFGTDEQADDFKPFNFPQNSIVYTGTHDNDTIVGWFTSTEAGDSTRSMEEVQQERDYVLQYLGTDGKEIHWEMIRLALSSVARVAIIPVQDLLGIGAEGRMNVPARESGNWGWRYQAEALTATIGKRLAKLTAVYGRKPKTTTAPEQVETESPE
ncbi:MAG: 4-alpha-glucanotransferase [Blastocatellia bacterium]